MANLCNRYHEQIEPSARDNEEDEDTGSDRMLSTRQIPVMEEMQSMETEDPLRVLHSSETLSAEQIPSTEQGAEASETPSITSPGK